MANNKVCGYLQTKHGKLRKNKNSLVAEIQMLSIFEMRTKKESNLEEPLGNINCA